VLDAEHALLIIELEAKRPGILGQLATIFRGVANHVDRNSFLVLHEEKMDYGSTRGLKSQATRRPEDIAFLQTATLQAEA
jgi:hypothetical protein